VRETNGGSHRPRLLPLFIIITQRREVGHVQLLLLFAPLALADFLSCAILVVKYMRPGQRATASDHLEKLCLDFHEIWGIDRAVSSLEQLTEVWKVLIGDTFCGVCRLAHAIHTRAQQ